MRVDEPGCEAPEDVLPRLVVDEGGAGIGVAYSAAEHSLGNDKQLVRPNQLFVIAQRMLRSGISDADSGTALVDDETRKDVFRRLTSGLVYPHGVASLSQED